ncbi:MAG: ABC transporter ATP-binding protein [Chloroflexi bacterium]|nr:ABC transporter ATP-binding protein [Chloroflexota bacterium]
MNNLAVWKRVFSYLRPYRGWALLAIFGIVGGTLLQLAIPTILRDVVDIGIAREDADYMLAAGLLIVALGVVRGLMGFFARFFGEKLSHHVAYDIRNETYDKVQELSFAYHNRAHTGTLITRAISDVDEIQRFYAFGLLDGLTTLVLFLGVAAIMITTSPLLAVIGLLPMIPLAILSRNFAQLVEPRWKKVMERIQVLSDHLQENAVGAQVVRAFARERYEIGRWNENNEHLYHEQLDLINRWTIYLPISAFIIAMSTALVLVFGGLMQQADFAGVTVGTVVQFNAFILIMGGPMRFVGFVILLATQAVTSAARIFEILDEPVTVTSKPDAIEAPTIKGHVKMVDVEFAYDDQPDRPVLKDINLEAQPGQIIALLGKTGSGKSSLINLITRFFDVTKGQVLIDGIDVRDMDLVSLRRQIGVVSQESMLFSASIRANIAYGRPEASEEEVIEAARAANAHDFIMEFPDGYDTLIGERGVTLSGGQRQRVAIARALLIDPHILILDDSTSSVDTKTEFEIQEALSRLMENRTTFVIAQRLTTVQNADQILVLDRGQIVERGTHQELLDQDGLYAEIYRLQLEDQERLKHELMALGGLVERPEKRSSQEIRLHVPNSFSGD